MTAHIVELVVVNELYFLLGAGAAAAIGLVDARLETWWRLPAAYLLGVAIVGVVASYAALFGYAVGWGTLLVATAVALVAGSVRLLRGRAPTAWPPRRRLTAGEAWAAVTLLAIVAVVVGFSARLQAVRPLVEWDGWAMWTLKARVLYELPDTAAAVLRDPDYGHPTYPLVLPSLEAIGFRATGTFDPALVGVQFAFLLAGLVGLVWTFCRDHCSPAVVALVLVVLVGAPQLHYQLATKFADVPLALFVGAGLVALARWLMGEASEPWALGCGVVLLGAAGLVKNEGLLFVMAAAGAVILAAVTLGRRPVVQAAAAGAALAAIVLPWRVYTAAHHLPTSDYDLADLFDVGYLVDHADRVRPVLEELWSQMTTADNWNWIVAVVLVSLVGCAAAGDRPVAVFACAWLVLAFSGLIATYWISSLPLAGNITNSSNRTIDALVVGGACLTAPLLRRLPEVAGAVLRPVLRAGRGAG